MANKIRGFAHLFGRSASASEDNDDEKEKSKNAKTRRAEDDDSDENDDGDDKEKPSKSRRAEDNDDSDGGDDDDTNKGRRAEDDDDPDADEGDEDDGDADEDDRDVKKGRRAERNRISRILGSKYAAGKGPLAVSLAITTGMSSAAAIRLLATSGTTAPVNQRRRLSLDERMSRVENHRLGNDGDSNSEQASSVVSRATSLYNQVKGKK